MKKGKSNPRGWLPSGNELESLLSKLDKGMNAYNERVREARVLAVQIGNPDVRIKDPLSDVTRKERRGLLAVSLISLLLVYVGLIPKKISSFGFEFESVHIEAITNILIGVVAYYLITFGIYAASDFYTWLIQIRTAKPVDIGIEPLDKNEVTQDADSLDRVNEMLRDAEERLLKINRNYKDIVSSIKFVSVVRVIVEFLLPTLFSIAVLIRLLTWHPDASPNSNAKPQTTTTADTISETRHEK